MTTSRQNRPPQSSLRNGLLTRLSPEDFALLAAELDHATFARGEVLIEADAPIPRLHFPEDGIASIIVRSPEGQQVEAGLVGREGFVHPAVLNGADSIPYRVEVQVTCEAYSIPTATLLAAAEASGSLRRLLLLFAEAQAVQSAFTSLSYAAHEIGERLARWLLMCQDRCGGDTIVLTHNFLSIMLSVRRPTVTNALHILEGNGFIRAERSAITIRDRAALEEYAADAYGRPEAAYRRLLGPL